jgi:esterase/lipase superfamily enzyme
MNQEHHRWYSQRIGKEMGVRVHGHYGLPILVFPTSGGDEWEYEGQGMIGALAHHIDAGRVKFFCVDSINDESWLNKDAHPRHRSYLQAMYDAYVAFEVVPFIHDHCRTRGIEITTSGASFGAYHAANTLLKHPDLVKRCLAQSGIYDMRRYMDGDYDDNFYFNNPVDYVSGLSDEWYLGHLRQADIRLITGSGPFENSGPSHQLAGVLRARGIPCSVDDWGADGGHDWPYWKRQMDLYIGRLF